MDLRKGRYDGNVNSNSGIGFGRTNSMGILDNAKDVAALVKKMGNIELYQKIVDLQSEIVALSTENLELQEEKKQLKEQLEVKNKMSFKEPFWYAEGDEVPHCPNCWESEKKAVHLISLGEWSPGPRYDCPSCKMIYHWPYREPPTISGQTDEYL
jgi:hypothetical protein